MTDKAGMSRIILAFEASADQASVCLLLADGRSYQQVHAARHGHAAVITQLGRDVVAEAGLAMSGITHVAAGRGPGSFTGIRVALAAAKGICLATGAQWIGISSLAAMAHSAAPLLAGLPVLATADTRRGSFFAQLFGADGMAEGSIFELDPESDAPLPAGCHNAHVIGAGAEIIAATWPEAALIVHAHPPIDARQIASLADISLSDRLLSSNFLRGEPSGPGRSIDPLVPLYVAPAFLGPRRA